MLVLAAYGQTLGSSFHFDDYAIFADPYLTAGDGWWRVFRSQQTRPLTYFTFWLNYRLGGEQPAGYHALNLTIHFGAVIAAWAALGRLLNARSALIAAAVFALHPLQSETVAYVFARATLLAALFCLLSWRSWIDGRWWRATGWFTLGLLSKEECAAFPLFLLLLDWAQGRWRKEVWLAWTAMIAASAAAGARLLYIASQTRGAGLGAAAGITPWTYALTQPRVILNYLLLFVAPVGQNFDHDVRAQAGWNWTAPTMLFFALVGVALWRLRYGVWLGGALVLLAPSSSVIPVADLMFEHRMYLPIVSLAAGAGMLLGRAPRAIAIGLVLALAGAAWSRARVWSTEETLWTDAATKSPAKARPKLQLARALSRRDPARAERLILEAGRLDPGNPETFTQMGTLFLDRGDPARALAEFDEAARLQSQSADAHSNRGVALYLLGRWAEAEVAFRRALELDPGHANARRNLRLVEQARGR